MKRRMRIAALLAVVLVIVAGVVAIAPAAQGNEPDTQVRITARKLADGRVEFGLLQSTANRA